MGNHCVVERFVWLSMDFSSRSQGEITPIHFGRNHRVIPSLFLASLPCHLAGREINQTLPPACVIYHTSSATTKELTRIAFSDDDENGKIHV
jgi:hypothetical protein